MERKQPHRTARPAGGFPVEVGVWRTHLDNDSEIRVYPKLPNDQYDFFEFYFAQADNDVDVEVSVTVHAGSARVFTSKHERFPSPLRAVSGYLGYWDSHTGRVAQIVDAIVPRDVTFTAANVFRAVSSEAWNSGETVVITDKNSAGGGKDCSAAGTYLVANRGSPQDTEANDPIQLIGDVNILATVTTSNEEKNNDCQISRAAVTSTTL